VVRRGFGGRVAKMAKSSPHMTAPQRNKIQKRGSHRQNRCAKCFEMPHTPCLCDVRLQIHSDISAVCLSLPLCGLARLGGTSNFATEQDTGLPFVAPEAVYKFLQNAANSKPQRCPVAILWPKNASARVRVRVRVRVFGLYKIPATCSTQTFC
jgi:hypothetical protein